MVIIKREQREKGIKKFTKNWGQTKPNKVGIGIGGLNNSFEGSLYLFYI